MPFRKRCRKASKILASCVIKTFMDSSNVKEVRPKLHALCLDEISSLDSSMNMLRKKAAG